MTSLAPYLITKYFPLPFHSSLAGTFLVAVSLKFSSLGWGSSKAASFPFPLIRIKLKASDADGFGKTTAWGLFVLLLQVQLREQRGAWVKPEPR